ncbi:MAG: homocysteine S-methyltransferase family protein [Chloroflexota bacterium]|nr:homocysteine S-methyltransferase family protein [Chloroflexota bacterium]
MAIRLPSESDRIYYTDGGMETTFIFLDGMDLPEFASFPLLDSATGRDRLRDYYHSYLRIAAEQDAGFVMEAPTWRANPDWGEKLGYGAAALDRINREAIAFMRELAAESGVEDIVVSGAIGPRGDGYVIGDAMTSGEAAAYHAPQVRSLAVAGADLVTALTLNYTEEAIGVARAAARVGVPAVISFTVETDGRLPSGEELGRAIERVDAEAPGTVAYFMINCAHPTHFADALEADAPWLSRIRGLRANASAMSHAELDAATELDRGDPDDLAVRYAGLLSQVPEMNVLGGCCGTDHHHVAAIAGAINGPTAAWA